MSGRWKTLLTDKIIAAWRLLAALQARGAEPGDVVSFQLR